MLFHPAMYGLFSFCVGSVICAGASQLRPRGYPRYIVMTLGVTLVLLASGWPSSDTPFFFDSLIMATPAAHGPPLVGMV